MLQNANSLPDRRITLNDFEYGWKNEEREMEKHVS